MSKTLDRLQVLMVNNKINENRFLRLLIDYIDETNQLENFIDYLNRKGKINKNRLRQR